MSCLWQRTAAPVAIFFSILFLFLPKRIREDGDEQTSTEQQKDEWICMCMYLYNQTIEKDSLGWKIKKINMKITTVFQEMVSTVIYESTYKKQPHSSSSRLITAPTWQC